MSFSAAALKHQAAEHGFNLIGITRAQPSPTLDAYLRWIAAGMHGSMGYMAREDRVARRRDLDVIVPGARSLVVVGVDYAAALQADFRDALHDPARGRIAAYAWGLDYHDRITPRLDALAAWLAAEAGSGPGQRVYVDTGALLERGHAQQAGLGFVGKNTMLIHPRRGSNFFLGEIVTTLDFDAYDTPGRESMCGTCTRCLPACPTDAFPRPFVLDARRCISYLTIEHKGWIDRDLRPLMGNWVFGCDVCQDVCPWQRFAPGTSDPALATADPDRAAPPLDALLALDDAAFQARFHGTPVYRVKRARLVRNACIAAGNSADSRFVPALVRLLADDSPLVRGHAGWALHHLDATAARPHLLRRLDRETDPDARAEFAALVQ